MFLGESFWGTWHPSADYAPDMFNTIFGENGQSPSSFWSEFGDLMYYVANMKSYTIDFIIFGQEEGSDNLVHTINYTMNVEMGNAFTWTENEPDYLVGDVNGDGILNVIDVVILVNLVLSGGDGGTPAGDINEDGILNVIDVVQLVNLVLNA